GCAIELDPAAIDAVRFERLRREGEAAHAAGPLGRCSDARGDDDRRCRTDEALPDGEELERGGRGAHTCPGDVEMQANKVAARAPVPRVPSRFLVVIVDSSARADQGEPSAVNRTAATQ